MRRGDVYNARVDPSEGSEQSGLRPVIILSRDGINANGPVVVAVPCTTYRGKRLFPGDVRIAAPEGGLTADSVALGGQIKALSKSRFGGRRGAVSTEVIKELERAIAIVLDLSNCSQK